MIYRLVMLLVSNVSRSRGYHDDDILGDSHHSVLHIRDDSPHLKENHRLIVPHFLHDIRNIFRICHRVVSHALRDIMSIINGMFRPSEHTMISEISTNSSPSSSVSGGSSLSSTSQKEVDRRLSSRDFFSPHAIKLSSRLEDEPSS